MSSTTSNSSDGKSKPSPQPNGNQKPFSIKIDPQDIDGNHKPSKSLVQDNENFMQLMNSFIKQVQSNISKKRKKHSDSDDDDIESSISSKQDVSSLDSSSLLSYSSQVSFSAETKRSLKLSKTNEIFEQKLSRSLKRHAETRKKIRLEKKRLEKKHKRQIQSLKKNKAFVLINKSEKMEKYNVDLFKISNYICSLAQLKK